MNNMQKTTQQQSQLTLREQALQLKTDINRMASEFKNALPENVTPEKFIRVVLNTVLNNPEFLKCDRQSLFSAAMKCAADGLFPDNREAAMIPYGGIVQYQPMVGGIYKRARNSGEIAFLCAELVHPDDVFEYGTNSERGRYLDHKPKRGSSRNVKDITEVYAISKTKDGNIDFEVMTKQEIEFVRSKSKSQNSPAWRDWWGEMAKKTVVKRLAKRLPTSADVQQLLDHDNDDYDLDTPAPKSKADDLNDRLAAGDFGSPVIEVVGTDIPEEKSTDPEAFDNFTGGPAK